MIYANLVNFGFLFVLFQSIFQSLYSSKNDKYIVSFIVWHRFISFCMAFTTSFLSRLNKLKCISHSKRYGQFIDFRRSLTTKSKNNKHTTKDVHKESGTNFNVPSNQWNQLPHNSRGLFKQHHNKSESVLNHAQLCKFRHSKF